VDINSNIGELPLGKGYVSMPNGSKKEVSFKKSSHSNNYSTEDMMAMSDEDLTQLSNALIGRPSMFGSPAIFLDPLWSTNNELKERTERLGLFMMKDQ
jgi:hypothetical protein